MSSVDFLGNEEYDYVFKVLLIGNSGVGKSCLLLRFVDHTYTDAYISTIGVDFKIKTMTVGGKVVKLQIWDTAGQERFRTITQSYYRGASYLVIVYDITDSESFRDVRSWIQEVQRYANQDVQMMLVGNKSDLAPGNRAVDKDEAEAFAKDAGMTFVETSAKSSTNVEKMFDSMVAELLSKRLSISAVGPGGAITPHPTNGVDLSTPARWSERCSC